ncbi:MAG: hypothetical protein ACLPID_19090 [Beijerinckiaceae bacterium]
MQATRYFEEQVLRKRAYIEREMCSSVVAAPLRRVVQADGRIRYWGNVIDRRDGKLRILRVITLEDGETIHNAFFDRDFQKDGP